MIPYSQDALRLIHEGSRALSVVEQNGIRVDTDYLRRTQTTLRQKIKERREELRDTDLWGMWRRVFGSDADLNKREQLAKVLFDCYEHECHKFTATGKPSTDEENLKKTKHPFVDRYLGLQKMQKADSTYLHNLLLEECDGFIHPGFSLNHVVSFRSASSKINFQNIPVRDPLMGRLIRRAFIPREGHTLVEVDIVAAEVRIAACYHQDPTMLEYIRTGYDLHGDMASDCFKIPRRRVPKKVRQEAKGKFVFAAFYGDWYKQIAENLWWAADGLEYDGAPLMHHMKAMDIGTLESFTAHIEKVYDDFWYKRFPVYTQWKQDWWQAYQEDGWFQMLTEFVCQGIYRRNEVINYGTQGVSFHCLLWSLIQLVQWLKQKRMQSVVVGQVHDSIICDIADSELPEVLGFIKDVMTQRLLKHWPWIIVPMEIEAEASSRSWYDKQEIAI